jgi:hypothetical protein
MSRWFRVVYPPRLTHRTVLDIKVEQSRECWPHGSAPSMAGSH